MNHVKDNVAHTAPQRCKYQHQYENRIFHCKVRVTSFEIESKHYLHRTMQHRIRHKQVVQKVC